MMKKLLVLMLVLSMVTAASATISWELRKADGVTAITEVNINEDGGNFCLVLTGLASDLDPYYKRGVYEDGYSYGGGMMDFTGGTLYDAAGNLGYLSALDTTYDGFALACGQLGPNPPVAADGDWIKLTATALQEGSAKVLLEEFVSPYGLLGTIEFNIVPEPVTIALLGLGGLFLRRRK